MQSSPTHHKRLLSGIGMGALVVLAAVVGGWLWAALTLVFFPIAYQEMLGLMAAKGIAPSKAVVIILCMLFYGFAFLGLERHFDILVTVGIIVTFAWLLFRKHPASISDIGATILMFFYLGFLPAHFLLLRQLGAAQQPLVWLQPGVRYLFLILFIVSASDIFAYYAGKRFGKNLLSPQISPKKTVEGSLIGTSIAVAIATLAAVFFGLHWGHGLALGLLVSYIAQVGDLSESLFKRDAGVKDSGSLIPGHGGVLDRTDSYIFSGAVGYYYVVWFVLHQGIAAEVMEFFAR